MLTAEGINDQGVIVGNVFDPAVGTFLGYAATPYGNTANAKQSSTGSGQLTTGATAPKVILPAGSAHSFEGSCAPACSLDVHDEVLSGVSAAGPPAPTVQHDLQS